MLCHEKKINFISLNYTISFVCHPLGPTPRRYLKLQLWYIGTTVSVRICNGMSARLRKAYSQFACSARAASCCQLLAIIIFCCLNQRFCFAYICRALHGCFLRKNFRIVLPTAHHNNAFLKYLSVILLAILHLFFCGLLLLYVVSRFTVLLLAWQQQPRSFYNSARRTIHKPLLTIVLHIIRINTNLASSAPRSMQYHLIVL